METRHYWEENGHSAKYDNYSPNDTFGRGANDQLNFTAPSEDEAEYPPSGYLKKGKVSRQDPLSHRIIEKRRRDRMNNCLADLSRLIPPEYLKKGRGRVEKTEIIEMAIRHLKYLQERVNVTERQTGEDFRAGYQEAVSEAIRFLVEVQGYGQNDGLCASMSSHLLRHCEGVIKGEPVSREKPRLRPGLSTETTSSSSSSQGYSMKAPVITQAPPPAPPTFIQETYGGRQPDPSYVLDCDRDIEVVLPDMEPLPLDGRRKCEPTLRTVRKNDNVDDYLHSYKFKNSIERRFSRSQDEAAEQGTQNGGSNHSKALTQKRRRMMKPEVSTSTSASASTSGSTEDARDTSPQDTSSESPHHHHFDKHLPQTQYVPVFALNALGKYYVPLSIDYSCLARHLVSYDVLDARAAHASASLHPVTIHVNFQPCLNYHVKRETNDRDWRAM